MRNFLIALMVFGWPFSLGADDRKPAWLGVSTSMVPAAVRAHVELAAESGLLVDGVIPGSPAAKAGLERYDILYKFNDQILVNPQQLTSLIRMVGVDGKVDLTVIRKGKPTTVAVKLGEREHVARWMARPGQMVFPQVVPKSDGRDVEFRVEMAPQLFQGGVYLERPRAGIVTNDSAEGRLRTLVSKIVEFNGYSNWSDGEHDLTLTSREGKNYLVVKKIDGGKVVWQGDVTTEKGQQLIPELLKAKFRQLHQTRQLQTLNEDVRKIEDMIRILEDGTTLRVMVTDPEQLKKLGVVTEEKDADEATEDESGPSRPD